MPGFEVFGYQFVLLEGEEIGANNHGGEGASKICCRHLLEVNPVNFISGVNPGGKPGAGGAGKLVGG